MKSKIRVRLQFSISPPLLPSAKKFMFLINKSESHCVSDIEHLVSQKFGFSNSQSMSLSIDGCILMPNDDVEIIRDGDEINVEVEGISPFVSSDQVSTSPKSVDETEIMTLENKPIKKSKKKHVRKRHQSTSANDTESLPNSKKVKHSKNSKESTAKQDTVLEGKGEILKADNLVSNVSCKNEKKSKKHNKKMKVEKSKKKKTAKHSSSVEICNQDSKCSNNISSNAKTTLLNYNTQYDRKVLSNHHTNFTDPIVESPSKKLNFDNSISFNSKSHIPSTSYNSILLTKANDMNVVCNWDKKYDKPSCRLVDNYDALTNLSWPPRNGDLIAFKLLEMVENYTPEISDFMEAKVVKVIGSVPIDATLCIDIYWPVQKKSHRVGKFDLVYDDHDSNLDDVGGDNLQTVSWNCLLEPKLIQ